MKKLLLSILISLIANVTVIAQGDIAAGEITYKWISGNTYDFEVIICTHDTSIAFSPSIGINWGDGANASLPRNSKINIGSNISENIYNGSHTYSSPDTYIVSIDSLGNRTAGIVNIPNSVDVLFYIEAEIVINPSLGHTGSPSFLNPPVAVAYIDSVFTYNSDTTNVSDDSISYQLIPCKGEDGYAIPGYSYPAASNYFGVDTITGTILWDKPEMLGFYNVALLVKEWRLGQEIGYVIRDIQIDVKNANGIESFYDNNLIYIFPNPANDELTIQIGIGDLGSYICGTSPSIKLVIQIYDLVGNLVLEKNLTNIKTNIDVSALAKGMYFVKVKTEKGVAVKKFIKE